MSGVLFLLTLLGWREDYWPLPRKQVARETWLVYDTRDRGRLFAALEKADAHQTPSWRWRRNVVMYLSSRLRTHAFYCGLSFGLLFGAVFGGMFGVALGSVAACVFITGFSMLSFALLLTFAGCPHKGREHCENAMRMLEDTQVRAKQTELGT